MLCNECMKYILYNEVYMYFEKEEQNREKSKSKCITVVPVVQGIDCF